MICVVQDSQRRQHFAAMAFVLATFSFALADEPAKKSKADWDKWRQEVRDRVAKGQRKMESQRNEGAPRPADDANADRYEQAKRRVHSQESVHRHGENEVYYKLQVGKQFAYRVEILIDDLTGTARLAGDVFFDVRSMVDKEIAQLHAIGRLRYSRRKGTGKTFEPASDGDVWIGSYIKVDPRAEHLGGRAELDSGDFPPALKQIFELKRLFFVELPFAEGKRIGHSKPGNFIDTGGSSFLGGPTIQMIKGREDFEVQTGESTGGIVPVHRTKAVYAIEGDKRSYRYDGKSRFDKNTGLLLETDATAIFESKSKVERKMTFTVRPLSGADFDKARIEASAVMKQRPKPLYPVELLRQRIEINAIHLPWMKSLTGLKPGTAVVHFREGDMTSSDPALHDVDYKFYRAKVVAVSEWDNTVRIRYDGSNEEFNTKPIRLVLLSEAVLKNPP